MKGSEITTLVEGRPGIFVIGSSNVGKRTLLSRLLSVDFDDSTSQTEMLDCTINTKYYTADVSVWMSHIYDNYSLPNLPRSQEPLVALVMVLDLSELSTLVVLQDWVSHSDINSFDILLCIGNKADLVPHHPAHDEYRRRRGGATDSSSDIVISESRLLGRSDDDASPLDIRGRCIEWCRDKNIEFIEACATNPDFDKCLSVDGDSQGVERLFGALSAHMWPGMILKSGEPVNSEEFSEEESGYELEYQVLSSSSADPWEYISEAHSYTDAGGSTTSREIAVVENKMVNPTEDEVLQPSGPQSETEDKAVEEKPLDKFYEFEDMEQLMSEIGNIRDNLRLMHDFQRREIAANLAMKMASMFGGGDSDDEEDSESPSPGRSIGAVDNGSALKIRHVPRPMLVPPRSMISLLLSKKSSDSVVRSGSSIYHSFIILGGVIFPTIAMCCYGGMSYQNAGKEGYPRNQRWGIHCFSEHNT